jgi:hypothetical protein
VGIGVGGQVTILPEPCPHGRSIGRVVVGVGGIVEVGGQVTP